ncbi:guanylate-binding protein 1 isoform X2 [Mesocricetus auratus]|uniref:Guanylate-binding protein 1 isoform X2 n=1 Tax=Mesocricetus auratus TaxID=10036 RepID=A0A3Q0D8Y8_MESAU|nr:guanylate-binding protein 1 isoform X2 [Mesocricetus auratus]
MATEVHMPGPMCLIENVKGQLIANQEALGILSDITQPVVVVAIVGLYRTGKSYLMNKLAGKKTGFSLGSTVQAHTKGIWMWCVPHPKKAGHTLALLDTEGLGDVEKGDNQNDCWIFALAILLSSTFVYNSMGAINQQAIDQLHYVTELTDRIRSRSSPEQDEVQDSHEFVRFFPDFVWALRDFSLELKVNGKPISADEYLENSLNLKHGTGQKDKVKVLNLPQLCIHKFFPKKKCFVFEQPVHGKKLVQLESLQDQDLHSNFVEQVAEFCSYLFNSSKVKTLSGGIKVNGPRLKSLVVTYVNTISSGGLPCIENAVLALSQTENATAVQKAIAHYDQRMSQKLQLPTETLQELMSLHRASEKEAIKIFMENSFKDVNQVFMTKLVAEEVLQQFLQSKDDVISTILQIDQDLTEKEKNIEVEHVKAEAAQTTVQIQQEMQQKIEQLLHQKEKTHEEHMKQLTEMMEKGQAQVREMQQKNEQLLQQREETHEERMKQLTEKTEEVQIQMREMQQKNEQLLQQKRNHEERIKQLTETMEKTQAQMQEMHQKNEQLLQVKKSHKERVKELTEKMAKTQNDYEKVCQLYSQEREENIKLKEELRHLKEKRCFIS